MDESWKYENDLSSCDGFCHQGHELAPMANTHLYTYVCSTKPLVVIMIHTPLNFLVLGYVQLPFIFPFSLKWGKEQKKGKGRIFKR